MTTIIIYLVAGISTTAFVILWFWVARQELLAKQSTVQSAGSQLIVCHKKYLQSEDGLEEINAKNILLRSQDIYIQSVKLYNQTLKKPWNRIPGIFMGFCMLDEKED
ncbi:hypothetical protein AAC978_10925 [Desulfitobacterium sp. THU1]|uniref:hypothetical protein n=1 Tax=Desulfitobacterium sp. THU1 TaxID=3138072 RepID=UPI00311D6721